MCMSSTASAVEPWELTTPDPSAARIRVAFDLVRSGGVSGPAGEFFRNKDECYARFGSQAASNYGKHADVGLHLIVARDRDGAQIGGVAIYDRILQTPLPLEIAIGHEPCVLAEIKTWAAERSVVEFSGLWISEDWRKTGLSKQLLLIAMSAAHHLQASKVVGFSHHHVMDFYRTIGLLPHPNAQRFYYPHAPYVSMMVWGDPVGFSTMPENAMAEVRAYVKNLECGSRLEWSP